MSPGRERAAHRPRVCCELYVTDVAQSLEVFAGALELALVRQEPGLAVLGLGDAELLLNEAAPSDVESGNPYGTAPDAPRGVGVELGIVVEDLAATFTRVSALDTIQITSLPEVRPWGARDFRFLHLDGYYVRVSDR